MLALTDFAQVALTLGPALITGAVGYLGARLQYSIGDRDEQHQQRRTRKEVYQRFLEMVMAEVRYWSHAEEIGSTDLNHLQRESHSCVTELYLVATTRVADTARAWVKLSIEIDELVNGKMEAEVADGRHAKEAFYAALDTAFPKFEDQIEDIRDQLVAAMRADVGPPDES